MSCKLVHLSSNSMASTQYKTNCHCFLLRFLFTLLFLFSYLDTMKFCLSDENFNFKCIETEREALLDFKEGLTDPSGRLSSWVGEDCCRWRGIGCDNQTGHIIKMDLRNPFESRGNILHAAAGESSCLGGKIHPSLLELKHLNHLDLSLNNFKGIQIPNFLGMLQNLRYLNLISAGFSGEIPPQLGNLSSLQYLDLYSSQYFVLHAKSLHWLSSLSSLKHLNLGYVNLFKTSTNWLQAINLLPSLLELHLRGCGLEYRDLHNPLVNLTSHVTLNMTTNFFNTSLPDLSLTNLTGRLIGSFCSLRTLDLSHNEFNVGLDEFLGGFSSCPSNRLTWLDLSYNKLVGKLPESLGLLQKLHYLDLSANSFWGPISTSITNASWLYLHDNLFSGSIPENIGELMPSLRELEISGNLFNGSIPSSICEMKNLEVLSLRSNRFSGQLPDCFDKMVKLWALDASNNSISGIIPKSMGNLRSLQALLLSNNNLSGEIPTFLQNCSALKFLDLSRNRFRRNLPTWIGESLPSLLFLILGYNFFTGKIPLELCSLSHLHFLDLSYNNFSGTIPTCLNALTALVNSNYDPYHDQVQYRYMINYDGHRPVVRTTRMELQYSGILPPFKGIDLSVNNLSGIIPNEISSLSLLEFLNLSMNHLTGRIAEDIGNLQWLASLDLSYNNLSGPIPQSLPSLTILSQLSLSYNNLVGRIPSGNRLDTMSNDSYEGNPLLCGVPLSSSCPGDTTSSSEDEKDGDDDYEKLWLYLSVILGFIMGFWGVCGTLVIKMSWRLAYFKFLDDMKQRISLSIALKVVHFRRMIGH